MFTSNDISLFLSWAMWSYYSVAHQSPWGFWSKERDRLFQIERKKTGNVGPSAAGYGTLWLIVPAFIVGAAFYFFREFEANGVYIANFPITVIMQLFLKIHRPLFFDYKLYTAATWMASVAFVLNVASCILMIVAEAWVSFALYTVHVMWVGYMVYVTAMFN